MEPWPKPSGSRLQLKRKKHTPTIDTNQKCRPWHPGQRTRSQISPEVTTFQGRRHQENEDQGKEPGEAGKHSRHGNQSNRKLLDRQKNKLSRLHNKISKTAAKANQPSPAQNHEGTAQGKLKSQGLEQKLYPFI